MELNWKKNGSTAKKNFLKFPLKRVQIFEQHLSNSSSLSCHFVHSLQTPKGLLSISWRKILQPFPVAYFSSSLPPLIFSFSALYYVDSLGLSSRKKSTYSLEERRKKIGLAISKFTLAGWGIAQVRVHSRVNSFWFLYTRYSLNVNLLLPSLVLLVHVLPTIMGGWAHGFMSYSAHCLTGTGSSWTQIGMDAHRYFLR